MVMKEKTLSPNIRMLRTALKVIGLLLMMEGVFIAVVSIASLVTKQYHAVSFMLISATITFFAGLLDYLIFRKQNIDIDKRTGFLIVTLIWVVFSLFGSLPYYLGGYIPNFIDAFFETMSGFTTTGSSILEDVESLPYGVGLWRLTTEWIGGIGIIVIMLSVFSFAGGGGTSLFSAEVAGIDKSKIAPRIKETSKALLIVYVSLTTIYGMTYYLLGMTPYDALCHAFTTAATAGFSSKNTSVMLFSPQIQVAMTCFMILSGTNLLFIYSIAKRNFKEIKRSEELRVYLSVIVLAALSIILINVLNDTSIIFSTDKLTSTIRHSFFMIASVLTSTGLVCCQFNLWPIGAVLILILLMNSGAMSGSTSGGLKLVRMMVLFKNARNTINKGIHSNAFIPVTINHKMLSDETLYNVFNMFMLYIITLVCGTLFLVAFGVNLQEAFVSSISALCNMGPGFGESWSGNFSHFSDLAKLTMAFMMCIGRLELITVFALFSKSLRRR